MREFPFYFARYGVAEQAYLETLRDEVPVADALLLFNNEIFTAVDLRPDSDTYCRWYGTELSADNGRMLYIPIGMAHVSAGDGVMVLHYWAPWEHHGAAQSAALDSLSHLEPFDRSGVDGSHDDRFFRSARTQHDAGTTAN